MLSGGRHVVGEMTKLEAKGGEISGGGEWKELYWRGGSTGLLEAKVSLETKRDLPEISVALETYSRHSAT